MSVKAAWRESLRPASFRGVAFEVEGHEHQTGRRGQLHEYPQRDKPYFEDLGLKAREFTVDAFVVGDDYHTRRDALLKACETEGSATLVHPYLGSRTAVCTSCRMVERVTEGRMARFTLTFTEAGENASPNGMVDYSSRMGVAADAANEATAADFKRRFDIRRLPGFVADSVGEVLTDAADAASGLAPSTEVAENAMEVASWGQAQYRAADGIASTMLGLVQNVAGSFPGASQAMKALRLMSTFDTGGRVASIPQTTSTRVAQADAMTRSGALVRRYALAEEARAFPAATWGSYQEASAASRDYASRVDAEMVADPNVDDGVYRAFTDLSASVVRFATEQAGGNSTPGSVSRGGGLPQITSTRLEASRPALVVAHDLYADATRDGDIAARNRVRHPGFVPAGVDLEVLSR